MIDLSTIILTVKITDAWCCSKWFLLQLSYLLFKQYYEVGTISIPILYTKQ